MSNMPVPNAPRLRKKTRPGSFRLLIILAALLAVLLLPGIAWNRQVEQAPALTATPLPSQLISTPTSLPAVTTGPDETTGIILAGAILVLIVLVGTWGATRRKS